MGSYVRKIPYKMYRALQAGNQASPSNPVVYNSDPRLSVVSSSSNGLVPAVSASPDPSKVFCEDLEWRTPSFWVTEEDVIATGATRSQVPDSASDVLLLSANTLRASAVIHNTSSALLRVALGTVAASAANFSFLLQPNERETVTNYTGEIRGIWDTDPGDGEAQITERTADGATGYANTSTRTQVTSVGTDILFLSSNSARRGVVIYNDNSAPLYIGEGITAVTSSNFSHLIPPNGAITIVNFTGQVRGMWGAGFDAGEAYVTERT